MIEREQAQQARHLSDDLDRLARGDDPRSGPADPARRALLDASALLDRELRGLRAARPGYQAALEARLLARLPTVRRCWWHRLAAPARPAVPRTVVIVAALALVIIVAGTAATASSRIRVFRPEGPRAAAPLVVPLLPPSGLVAYQPADPATAARETGRALAYLSAPPATFAGQVEVAFLPPGPPLDPNLVSIRTHALVRYQGSGGTALVILDEPSAALGGQHDIVLGERTIRLADGREAWASTRPNWPQGNVVAWIADGFIVIVASDLPPETVVALADQVVLAPAIGGSQGAATPTGTTPAPRNAVPPPSGSADLAISGAVRQGGWGWRPQLYYDLSLGNRGTGTANDVRVTIEPPPALAAHVVAPAPPRAFGPQGPGQLSGLGGDITFDILGLDSDTVRAALAGGLIVRVTWTEGGQPQERRFVIR